MSDLPGYIKSKGKFEEYFEETDDLNIKLKENILLYIGDIKKENDIYNGRGGLILGELNEPFVFYGAADGTEGGFYHRFTCGSELSDLTPGSLRYSLTNRKGKNIGTLISFLEHNHVYGETVSADGTLRIGSVKNSVAVHNEKHIYVDYDNLSSLNINSSIKLENENVILAGSTQIAPSSGGGLPEGLTYSDGILKVTPDQSSHHVGMEVEGLFKIDNKNDGTDSNLCLELPESNYLVKEKPTYIDVNETGLDETYNIQYTLNENGTCELTKANDSSIMEFPTICHNSIVRKFNKEKNDYSYYKIIKIGKDAFKNPEYYRAGAYIKEFPDTITDIEESSFYEVYHLNKISTFPLNLTHIGSSAFYMSPYYRDGTTADLTKVKSKSLVIDPNAFKESKFILHMTQALADSLGSRIVNGKIDDAIVQIVEV